MKKRIKVLTIFGTRPELIKLAPVIKALNRAPEVFEALSCTTAQHREMVDELLKQFKIKADFDLDIMRPNQTLSSLTANLIMKLDQLFHELKPDWILIQGDTTTVMAASLVAYYHRVKVGHVEAGLRTFDKWAPFPEEINRRITDLLSDLYFAPTAMSRDHLLNEGIADQSIVITGNTVIDALEYMREIGREQINPWLDTRKKRILFTAHRRENHGEPFQHICKAMRRLANAYAENIEIIFPVHPNPNIRETAYSMLQNVTNIRLIEPLPYQELLALMAASHLIVTDSGGIQEEAPSFGVPTLVLRDVTERPEGVTAGVIRLIGNKEDAIVAAVSELLENPATYQSMCAFKNPYGDGQAAERIVEAIRNYELE